jgi:hypothetical protein
MAFLKAQAALTKFKTQYNYWIKFSVIFLILLISTFIEWNNLVSLHRIDLWIGIVLFFTLIAAGWWYWTMFLVKTLVDQRQEEIKILNDVIADLKDIKNNLTNLDK